MCDALHASRLSLSLSFFRVRSSSPGGGGREPKARSHSNPLGTDQWEARTRFPDAPLRTSDRLYVSLERRDLLRGLREPRFAFSPFLLEPRLKSRHLCARGTRAASTGSTPPDLSQETGASEYWRQRSHARQWRMCQPRYVHKKTSPPTTQTVTCGLHTLASFSRSTDDDSPTSDERPPLATTLAIRLAISARSSSTSLCNSLACMSSKEPSPSGIHA